jgi:hypothetical protein
VTPPSLRRYPVALAAAAASLVVNLPLLLPGFVLTYDLVFVPREPLSAELLGISTALPRSVPTAGIVALLSHLLTGQVVQKIALLAIVGLGVGGAARLVRVRDPVARIGAGLLYMWNPATYERLLLGQWAYLLGYALLPFVVGAALSLREGRAGSGGRLVLAMAAAVAASPYAGLFAVAAAAAVVLWPAGRPSAGLRPDASRWRRARERAAAAGAGPGGVRHPWGRRAALVAATGVALNLPWLLPAAFHGGAPDRPVIAAEAFKARSDSPLGTAGSVVTLGGVWSTGFAPPGRTGWTWLPAFALIAGLAAWGARPAVRSLPRGSALGLAALAAAGLFLAIAPSVPGLRAVPRFLGSHLPGGGILRDAQKFEAFYAVLLSICFGHGIRCARERWAGRDLGTGRARGPRVARSTALAALAILPVALAPTLAWGAGGKLFTSSYPGSWTRADRILAADPAPGAMLVLPWHTYLPLAWNRGRTVLDPAPVFFGRHAVTDGSLDVGPYRIPAEDPWSRLLAPVALGRGPLDGRLARLGIRYVLLLKEADWRSFRPRIALAPLLDSPELALFRVGRPVTVPPFDEPPLGPVLAGDAAALVTVGLGASVAVRARRRRT